MDTEADNTTHDAGADSASSEARRPPLTKAVEADLQVAVDELRNCADFLEDGEKYPGELGKRLGAKRKALLRSIDFIERLTGASATKRSARTEPGDATSAATTPTSANEDGSAA